MTTFPFLQELVEEATAGLPAVSRRRMFGSDAYFVGDHIFALLWKTGRVGVKLPDAAAYAELLAVDGAEAWAIGEKKMGTWVLAPEAWHDEPAELRPWLHRAYAQVQASKATEKATKAGGAKARAGSSRATKAGGAKARAGSSRAMKAGAAKPSQAVRTKATKVGGAKATKAAGTKAAKAPAKPAKAAATKVTRAGVAKQAR